MWKECQTTAKTTPSVLNISLMPRQHQRWALGLTLILWHPSCIMVIWKSGGFGYKHTHVSYIIRNSSHPNVISLWYQGRWDAVQLTDRALWLFEGIKSVTFPCFYIWLNCKCMCVCVLKGEKTNNWKVDSVHSYSRHSEGHRFILSLSVLLFWCVILVLPRLWLTFQSRVSVRPDIIEY